ncbi:MAG TPA: pyridoxal phosphate-dependent aminotransferase [Polyangiaceae bacterium]|nr:pyridoxal phosphate-dependent aminotransferase [Polyangiaceae bacterium]
MTRPPFASRTAWDLHENTLAALVSEARRNGRDLADLTESNPTRCSIFPIEPLIELLGHPRGAAYQPASLGHPDARRAVARYYEERGLRAAEDQITLSASTSEAYGWLFKLLCERGDQVLVPAPSYPLLEYLAHLEDVTIAPYPLVREERFAIDLGALEELAASGRARAIALIHPNNPTGTFVRREQAEAVEALADRFGLALIVDEVFGDYAHKPLPADRLPSFAGRERALTFVLSGLSKVAALPQVKLGWIAASGPADRVGEAMRRLEVIADTYLSVSTPVQLALPEILAARGGIQRAILERVLQNLAALDGALEAFGENTAVRRLPVEGGWYAILQVPRTLDEDEWISLLVREEGVLVHPGYFFDMEREGFLVVSLLPEPKAFASAAARLIHRIEHAAGR